MPENRRQEFLQLVEGARWIAPERHHPDMASTALDLLAEQRIDDYPESVTTEATWSELDRNGATISCTVLGIRTPRRRLYFLDSGGGIVCVLIITTRKPHLRRMTST